MNRTAIYAGALLAVISTPVLAGERGNPNGGHDGGQHQHQGQNQGQAQGQGQSQSVDVSQDGDKTDALGVAVAPPSFSYAPGAAVGAEVITKSYAVGFPIIGGGIGEQGADLTPSGIAALAAQLKVAQTDRFVMAATCASSLGHKALESMNIDCDVAPVQ